MTRLLILSNGYGEDSLGVKLAQALQAQVSWLEPIAYPIVDIGTAYRRAHIPVVGLSQPMPSGGLMMHNWQLFWQDVEAGFASMTARQLLDLRQHRADAVLVVGDIYALLLSQLIAAPRFFVQSLVSVYHRNPRSRWQRHTMENVTILERRLMRHRCRRVYLRDEATARFLQQCGVKQACSLGNPMMDGLEGDSLESDVFAYPHGTQGIRLALLAGSRPYARDALTQMLTSLRSWGTQRPVHALVPWVRPAEELPSSLKTWQPLPTPPARGHLASYRTGHVHLHIFAGRFAACLAPAQLVWATSGTAQEQAAGLGKPVLSFALEPHYSNVFLHNQQRLLGDALTITQPAQLIAHSEALLADTDRYQRVSQQGRERMGIAGGSQRIAADIVQHLPTIK